MSQIAEGDEIRANDFDMDQRPEDDNHSIHSDAASNESTMGSLVTVSEYQADTLPSEAPIIKPLKSLEVRMQVLEGSIGSVSSVESAECDLQELSEIKGSIDGLFATYHEDSMIAAQLNLGKRVRQLRDKYLGILKRKRPSAENHVPGHGEMPLKLPCIDIPIFHGEVEKWNNFKSLFLNLISDSRIVNNEASKKWYLFKALKGGDALSLIENLEEENFKSLWKVVTDHYDDPRRRANTHLDQLLKGHPPKSIRQRLVFYRQHTTGLRSAYKELKLDPFEQIIITSFLDSDAIKPAVKFAWERRVIDQRASGSLSSFYKFMEEETVTAERAFGNKKVSKSGGRYQQNSTKQGHALVNAEQASSSQSSQAVFQKRCQLCHGQHYLNQCGQFKNNSVEERGNLVREKGLCPVCFNVADKCPGARGKAAECTKKHLFCYKCKAPHHWLLHRGGKNYLNLSPITITNKEVRKCIENSEKVNPVCLFNTQVTRTSPEYEPLLATVLLEVKTDHQVASTEARALLDNGSQFNFITSKLVKILGLNAINANVMICGIGSNSAQATKSVNVTLVSRYNSFEITIRCLVIESIVNSVVPSKYLDVSNWTLPNNLHLADPYFHVPSEINLLLGLDVFWQVLKHRTHALGPHLPKLKESEFGWIIAGSLRTTETTTGTMVFFVQLSNNDLLDQMAKFWIVEQYSLSKHPLTKDELECESIFQKTTYRQGDGRFVVSLPFKKDPALLGDSRFDALKQFMHLEKRLQNNLTMREKYVACMREYIELGHMRIISENSKSGPNYYLSHHAVINPTSTSTSQRTVFNASMKTTSGYSLNDLLHTGPINQRDLISILVCYRLYRYALSADIVKMYRQILMNDAHTIFQRVFWRESPDQPLKVYELTTVSFGERPAPYLATKCLNELSTKYGENYPNAKPVILTDFYMDNLFTGSNSLSHALAIQEEIISLLNSAGLPLSKWCANDPKLLERIDPSLIETSSRIGFDNMDMIKTLGMYWAPSDDTLRISFEKSNATDAKTKRQILGVIASIFDPMGLVGPVTAAAKCFMQEIWKCTVERSEIQGNSHDHKNSNSSKKRNIHWDDVVVDEILIPWQNFASKLHHLNHIKVPRHILPNSNDVIVELHGFADASSKAYGAVIYCRAINNGQVMVNIIRSRSRVAPLKQLSIARLELCAAVTLADLQDEVVSTLALKTNIACIRLWSDSKVALSWIASQSYKWNVFVAHRVSKIQTISKNAHWDYVQSASNPADILSRGANPEELAANQNWFFGPSWLSGSAEPWSDEIKFAPNQNLTEERKPLKGFAMLVQSFKSDIFNKVGLPDTGMDSTKLVFKQGYIRLQRLVAYCVRIFRNRLPYFPRPINADVGKTLKIHELKYALVVLIKLSQAEYFSQEIQLLQKGLPVVKESKLLSLNPFLDIDGVLRVGGRLEHSDMSYEERHPIILHPSHKLTTLIVLHEHLANLHLNKKSLISVLKLQYWIIRIKSCVSRCLKLCFTCVKFAAKTQTQIMADLPRERVVSPSKPFTHTGVDYAGPFLLMQLGGRSRKKYKVYIAVFICFATKAVHLETVSDLTTDKFLEALSRFISRRGRPAHLHSDNGTTFVGAKGALNEMYTLVKNNSSQIERFTVGQGIQWHFIPPRAPHFGGIWEASVKSVKRHLYRTIHTYTLVYDQFTTLLGQIEACLNSRPLTTESADPNDLNSLTPGHFLIGGPITALPSIDYSSVPDNRLKHWEQIQKLTQLFWKRWRTEYLNTLQQRYKWRQTSDELKLNDLVLIKEENLAPTQWKLGRIIELYSGKDNKKRVALLRTSSGEVKRPIVKLVLLPLTNSDNNDISTGYKSKAAEPKADKTETD